MPLSFGSSVHTRRATPCSWRSTSAGTSGRTFFSIQLVSKRPGWCQAKPAAFGTPTITNDTGGLSTTVAHGESGIVLPRSSRPEDYVDAIQGLVSRPEDYYSLCGSSTHKRYERELNSAFYGKRLVEVLQTAAQMAG